MKLISKQAVLPLLALALSFAGCDRDYDAPPLNEPVYEGEANITLAQLKEKYNAATADMPITISEDLVVKANITGNDESGNIYKQIIVQDATAAMPIQIDQGNVYTTYRRGQEVFINLKGMCVSVYGEQQQLGWPDGYLYRMPYNTFKEKVQKNGWPDAKQVTPEVVTDISSVNTDVTRFTYRLVKLEGVHFVNGGKNTFAPTDGYGEETLKDAHGNTITVRTSNYASFASEKLPVGTGTVTGVLGRFKGTWQLTIPVIDDVTNFDGVDPEGGSGDGDGGSDNELFHESFGEPVKGEYWPYVKDYSGFDNKTLTFGGSTDKLSARNQGGDGNIWFPTGGDYTLSMGTIDVKGADKITLVYTMSANVYQPSETQDVNTLGVKCNGVALTVPSKVLTGSNDPNIKEEITIKDIAVTGNVTLEFSCQSATNVKGLRLYDVKIVTSAGGSDIEPTPVP